MTSLPHAPAPAPAEVYDRFVAEHTDQFTRYLRRVLDRAAEGRGGRVGVEDTLQDALVRIYQEWRELAGLGREREAVAVIAVDHLGWDQRRVAEELGVGYSTLRETLYVARKLLSMTIRHATGVEVSQQEQAQLAALRAGELRGPERRAVARSRGILDAARLARPLTLSARPSVTAPSRFCPRCPTSWARMSWSGARSSRPRRSR